MTSLSIRKAGNLTGVQIHTESLSTCEPTHFVVLLDTSDSMNEEGKLDNVKRCISLLLQVIGSTDFISLITFASESKIHLTRVPADANHKAQIETTIRNLRTDGWTNLSAGLSNLAKILEGETIKTGVMLLTDGHANTGMRETPGLLAMIEGIRARHPQMSMSSLAYGTDHNSSLLLRIAQLGGSSSYSIVKNLEDAATAIGDCAGGFMSLLAQNVDVHFPVGTVIHTSYTVHNAEFSVFVRIGDLYSGTDTLLLVEFPGSNTNVTLTGTLCSTMEPLFIEQSTIVEIAGRDKELELTDIRNQVSNLFKELRTNPDGRTGTARTMEALRQRLSDEVLSGPVCDMLKSELTSIENILNGARVHATTLQQHEAFTGLGRGMTTTISSVPSSPRRLNRQVALGVSGMAASEDPVPMMSPFQSDAQRSVAATLRSMSQYQE